MTQSAEDRIELRHGTAGILPRILASILLKHQTLNGLSTANLAAQRHGFLHRGHVQHPGQRLHTEMILAQGQVALALPVVAAH